MRIVNRFSPSARLWMHDFSMVRTFRRVLYWFLCIYTNIIHFIRTQPPAFSSGFCAIFSCFVHFVRFCGRFSRKSWRVFLASSLDNMHFVCIIMSIPNRTDEPLVTGGNEYEKVTCSAACSHHGAEPRGLRLYRNDRRSGPDHRSCRHHHRDRRRTRSRRR